MLLLLLKVMRMLYGCCAVILNQDVVDAAAVTVDISADNAINVGTDTVNMKHVLL